jgi:hypothetical protein
MAKRDKIEPAGPQDDAAKKAQQERHEQRQRDIDQVKKDRGDDGV